MDLPVAVEELLGRQLNDIEKRFAPKMLYVQSNRELLRTGVRVSLVGSHEVSPEKQRRAHRLTKLLAEKGITVVSGLAVGVDTEAHWTAIDHHGRTVAILGTGLDRAYLSENEALQELIAYGHLVVSQFLLGTLFQWGNFLQRNWTMALVSDVTVIVEVGEGSGMQSQE